MNYSLQGYHHGAQGGFYLNPGTPTTPICPPVFPPMYRGPPGHGPLLGYPMAPRGHGPSTFDQAASHLGFSAVESRSLGHGGAPPSHTSRAEQDWLVFSSQPWVFTGGLEPMDARGRSILHQWLDRSGPQLYVCKVPIHGRPCGTTHNRQDRALTHVRKHLNARPYECNGQCGNPVCRDTFASPAYLKAHVNPVSRRCRYCNHDFLRQNVKRHEENCRMRL